MTKLGIVSLPAILLLGTLPLYAEASTPAPDFHEVYDLIRQHLADVNDAELNRIAVQALVSALNPRVVFVKDSGTETRKEDLVISKSSLFDGSIAYIRVVRVQDALDKALRQAWDQLGATNKLNGLVVDLRYAGGTDYAAAAATADLFTRKEQPLLDWGQGQVHSTDKNDSISPPLAVLVNHET